jgi:hypothetical protein
MLSHRNILVKLAFLALSVYLTPFSGCSQPTNPRSANLEIKPYTGPFEFGINMGLYPGWKDEELASIGYEKAGVTVVRPALPEHFLEYWGYNIREDAFKSYAAMGMKENVVFVGYPSEAHRDSTEFCPGVRTEVFKNLYEPIWDNGENGTPVNDKNYYALYLYKISKIYGHAIGIYEIWNEPDLNANGESWKTPGMPGNWWENPISPCDISIKAPVQYYIRMLRIAYEVLHSEDPDAYVAVGGVGIEPFVKRMLELTDNPIDGSITPEYPLKGGAWFDVMSFHCYPHIDNSLRYWSNDIMGFKYIRHSDKAADGYLKQAAKMEKYLVEAGYDDGVYPRKIMICTETNLPRRRVDEYIGDSESQKNYIMKAAIFSMQKNIVQLHPYLLADQFLDGHDYKEFAEMGLFERINGVPKGSEKLSPAGVGYSSLNKMLLLHTYNEAETKKMEIPSGIRGGAFLNANGEFTYVLWAETSQDLSEYARKIYNFPDEITGDVYDRFEWEYSKNSKVEKSTNKGIVLHGSPSFFRKTDSRHFIATKIDMSIFPNPSKTSLTISLSINKKTNLSLEIFNTLGQKMTTLFKDNPVDGGEIMLIPDISSYSPGTYFIKARADKETEVVKWVKN